jgi:hypothetical protein
MMGVAAADADRNSQTPPPPASAQQVEQDPIDQHDFKMWEFDSLGKIAAWIFCLEFKGALKLICCMHSILLRPGLVEEASRGQHNTLHAGWQTIHKKLMILL